MTNSNKAKDLKSAARVSDPRERAKVLVLGASAGGVVAIRRLLSRLSPQWRTPIVVVQHISPSTRIDVGLIYGNGGSREILETEDKMSLEPGRVYMASPGYHVLIEKDETLALSLDEPVHFSRPSIDLLFKSAARAFGPQTIGILLTGANSDGAEGLKCIHDAGGFTLVQDPEEAESSSMPRAALQIMKPDRVATLDLITDWLNANFSGQDVDAGAEFGAGVRSRK